MRNINFAVCGLMASLSVQVSAITIEDMSGKNNQLIELDQEIAIAEKHKKLTQLKNDVYQPEIRVLPASAISGRDESLSVLSVHGSPSDPIVDVQYGGVLLQKRRDEAMPGGWKIASIGYSSVTFRKKFPNKPDVVKTVSIGQGVLTGQEDSRPEGLPAIPSHSSIGK